MKKFFLLLAGILCLASCNQVPEVKQAGTVVRDTIQGTPCMVYLPNAYAARAAKGEIFPVLYLQHGMWGNEDDWTAKGRLVPIMDSLLRADKTIEMVVIMPDNCPGRPTYEEEKENATTGAWENGFADFMAESEAKYRISNDPARRAIAGLSMGGYHTMRVASVWDGQFAYVGMFSAATFVHEAPTSPKVFWLGMGKEDFLYEPFQAYRNWLETNHFEYTYYESTGGHDWPNWQEYLVRFLQKVR